LGTHKGENVIWIQFPNDKQLINHLRTKVKARWSCSEKCWYVPDRKNYRELFQISDWSVSKEVLAKIHVVNQEEFEKYVNMMYLKGYSENTIRTYSLEFAQLLYILKSVSVQSLSPEKLQSYFLYCIKELKLSENQIHSRINAVKFYFEQVLHKEKMFFDIPRPQKPLQLPKYLNSREIKKLFEATDNLKHRLILKLCYGMGLRVSEIVNLKISDIDSQDMKVMIRRGKGKKDRYVNLPESILEELRTYYQAYRPKEFLFEGQFGGAYSVRSAQMVFKNVMKKVKVKKQIGIHGLRHSYATHLLELGTDISHIQKLLGHSDIKTTMIYTHVSDKNLAKIKSPLDSFSEFK
jgi:integrase/recombinase XerD